MGFTDGSGWERDQEEFAKRRKSAPAVPVAVTTTLQSRIAELVARHGDIRAAVRVLQVDHAYLHRLGSGEKSNPSEKMLKKLGLKRIITVRYERA